MLLSVLSSKAVARVDASSLVKLLDHLDVCSSTEVRLSAAIFSVAAVVLFSQLLSNTPKVAVMSLQ